MLDSPARVEPRPCADMASDHTPQKAIALLGSGWAGFSIHCLLLLLFALEVPVVWVFAINLLGLDAFIRLMAFRGPSPHFMWRLVLLLLAVGTYWLVSVFHEYVSSWVAVQRTTTAVFAYAAGYWWSRATLVRGLTVWQLGGVFAGTLGATAYSFLAALAGGGVGAYLLLEIADRTAPDPWGGAPVGGTPFGARAALGLCLLAVSLFVVRERGRSARWVFLGTALVGAAGLYANAVLQNRMPFLALATAMGVCAVVLMRSDLPAGRRLARMLPLLLLGGLAVLLGIDDRLQVLGVYQRFGSEGVRTARYELWLDVLLRLFTTADGGRAFPITEDYAHNLWLDAGYDAGPVPFLTLLAFHASHINAIVLALRSAESTNARLLVWATIVPFFFAFMAEPAYAISPTYFALSCYFLGVLYAAAERSRAVAAVDV